MEMLDDYANAYTRAVTVRDIDERVKLIADKIREGRYDPVVRKLAAEAVRGVPARDWFGEVKAIWDFVRRNVRYTLDTYGRDFFQRARRTLQLGIGDCDDQVILMGSMLQAIGHPVLIKVIDTVGGEPGFNHVYLLTGIPPQNPVQWVPLDPTVDRPIGWEMPSEYVRRSKIYRIKE